MNRTLQADANACKPLSARWLKRMALIVTILGVLGGTLWGGVEAYASSEVDAAAEDTWRSRTDARLDQIEIRGHSMGVTQIKLLQRLGVPITTSELATLEAPPAPPPLR